MKYKILIINIFIAFLVSCSKNKNDLAVGTYNLEKTRYQEFEQNVVELDEWSINSVRATLKIKADNTFEIIYFDPEKEDFRSEKGTINPKEKTLYIQGNPSSYFYEDDYLVLITEDYRHQGSGNWSLAYFKKNK